MPNVPVAASSRRRFLTAAAALAAAPLLAAPARAGRVNPPALLDNRAGGYRVLPAGGVFCAGVVPLEGHEIVHVLLQPWIPLEPGWGFIEKYLERLGRPVQALCGMELRIPRQLTLEAFRAFNRPYAQQLAEWNLMLGPYSAVCRTNVVPARAAPDEPAVHAFSCCVPSEAIGTTFCVSGTADIDARGQIIAAGDVSPAAMKQRLQFCIEATTERLEMLELGWSAATHIDLCVAEDISGSMADVILPGLQSASARGIRVHHARPPIIGTEVELECRGCRRELVVPA